ncbi:hypothetical protein PybrP1_007444 [[Pythium] brassicae (nom. inval.)]|nr:hypothetical protein PybrP1_007444 [[Pythium] brassicae (nom. inval.)]
MRFFVNTHGFASVLLLASLGVALGDERAATASETVNRTKSAISADAAPAPLTELPLIDGLSTTLEELLGESLGQLLEEAETGDAERNFVADDGTGGARAQAPFDLAQLSLALADGEATAPDEFFAVNPQHPDVQSLVEQFMREYQAEVLATNLDADMLHVIKAETTLERPVLEEQTIGLGVELVQEELAREFHVFLLVKHRFKSSMFTDKRPYVTALRFSMACANRTTATAATRGVQLACELIDHADLPRMNESTTDVPDYIRHAIARSAPPSASSKRSAADVRVEAIEAQDVLYDAAGRPVRGEETIEYARFRVSSNSDAPDCMIVVQHARGISTLLYSDSVCYNDLAAHSVVMAAYQYTKDNYGAVALVAALVGALVAAALIYCRRSRQRSGYSYLQSKNGGRLPRLASRSSSMKAAGGGIGEPATAS